MKKAEAKIYRSVEDLPLVLTPEDVGAILGVSRNTAYAVIHSRGFPARTIGKQYRVHKNDFLAWMENAQSVELAN